MHTDTEVFFSTIISLLSSGLNYIIPFFLIAFLIWYIRWLIKQAIIDAINETNSRFDSNSRKLDTIIDLLRTIKTNSEEQKYSDNTKHLEKLNYLEQLNWWDSKKTTFAKRILDELKEVIKAIKAR